jgi:hypothetical protein
MMQGPFFGFDFNPCLYAIRVVAFDFNPEKTKQR